MGLSKRFEQWSLERGLKPTSAPAFSSNFAVYSYLTDRLTYLNLDGQEFSDPPPSILRTDDNCIPYLKADDFYPRLVIDTLSRMRFALERDSRADLHTKIVSIRGWRYRLGAWITSTDRHGRICVFTCSHAAEQPTDHRWHKQYFDAWFTAQIRDPDPRFQKDEMWVADYKGRDRDEFLATCVRKTPTGKKPIVHLMEKVLEPGILQVSETRSGSPPSGSPPCRITLFRVPSMELVFTQRTKLAN